MKTPLLHTKNLFSFKKKWDKSFLMFLNSYFPIWVEVVEGIAKSVKIWEQYCPVCSSQEPWDLELKSRKSPGVVVAFGAHVKAE